MMEDLLADDLTRRLATDLDGAFPLVVERMGRRLYWGLRRMSGDHHEAEDLAQEALIRAYQALSEYEHDRICELKLEPWLWTIALNLGRNHLRTRSRRPTFVKLTEPKGVEDPELVDGAAWDRRLSSLPPTQRTAVVLRHVVGLGIDEIVEITGRPAGTVKTDIHRGLNRLRTIMETESYDARA
ncbi:MAG TPA: RNA polymerase sigma factor [Acidimicrobiia bacterium]